MSAQELQRFAKELHERVARRCEEQTDCLRRQQEWLRQRALARERRLFNPRVEAVGDGCAFRAAPPDIDFS